MTSWLQFAIRYVGETEASWKKSGLMKPELSYQTKVSSETQPSCCVDASTAGPKRLAMVEGEFTKIQGNSEGIS